MGDWFLSKVHKKKWTEPRYTSHLKVTNAILHAVKVKEVIIVIT